jgi:hypothetical protein
MPEISRFLGIVIGMYWSDHAPPHFHAKYSGYEITVDIETGIVRGEFPKRALRAVLDWIGSTCIRTNCWPTGNWRCAMSR